jgi:hypothetical protein
MDAYFLDSNKFGILDTLLKARGVMDGEQVRAAVANRLPGASAANIEYLHELIKRGFDNSAVYLYDMPVSSETCIGDFVYYDTVDRVFKPGLARFLVRDGRFSAAETSAVWGVITEIRSDKADICTKGLCKFTVSSTEKYSDKILPGIKYLSSSVLGGLSDVSAMPFVCLGFLVAVHANRQVQFYVDGNLSANPSNHEHRSIELVNTPAGDWSTGSAIISETNTNLPGWLPASHEVFEGKAPPNAVFGYNPRFLPQSSLWLKFAHKTTLSWQRLSDLSDDPLLANIPVEFYRIDDTTIWWMTDIPRYFPWDYNLTYTQGETSASWAGYQPRLWLDIIDTVYGATDTVVSSLRAKVNSGLSVKSHPFGDDAVSGDLILDLFLKWLIVDQQDTDGTAIKKLNDREVTTGPVVSGLRIDSGLVSLQGIKDTDGYYSGRVTLGDASGMSYVELPFESVHLGNVEEAVEREIIGLAFPDDSVSFLIGRVVIPARGIFSEYMLHFSLGILLPHSGGLSSDALKLSYRKIPQPDVPNQIVGAFGQSELIPVAVDLTVNNTAATGGYFVTESAGILVKAGEVVFVKISREQFGSYHDRIILVKKAGLLKII